uniref:Oxidation resistance protein 1 n=1 Tax=Proboscia inermis TaxID=420281 RepID=A0A6T8NUY4_9STRA|mmetsp:Transcript_50466/g.50833  ORF Transcript_50466/g.50833 Transcript_50466/m.50833 type:complete len:257 (+) Transcript_50466:104-874(+)|eukprot:CAMPEP_0171316948 /NCGR_PEP_ID=MMETSP0816-20121228/76660_1 /TAXON_ID=420281 /ORGANISM="Proboscia inermis, Strain CCAP1064/1" /LENGTH=256 /DNA_ID=CAMNT_0011809573 /DNA_START=90 /DNA_END=860 /DNA_ORIENTATION=+
METLQNFLPISLSEQNFWLKYSLVRDGDTLHTLLRHARGSKNTLLAVETTGGEVFGSYTSEPWRKTWGYYGTGESFLWRLRQSRETSCSDDSSSSSGESSSHVKNRGGTISVLEQAKMESEVDVYPWTGENEMIQVCTTDRIAVGGGSLNVADSNPNKKSKHDIMHNVGDDNDTAAEKGASGDGGFGFALEADMLHGTSSPCATFGNPCLSRLHDNSGGVFEIVNVEVWTLTPCTTLEMAQKMEMSRLFLEENRVS